MAVVLAKTKTLGTKYRETGEISQAGFAYLKGQ